MNVATSLRDNPARVTAMTAHGRTLLVEAGAGVGKTAILAGRIALLLADGVPPRDIAAVTFTELAASQLLTRIRGFAEALAEGQVPLELAPALPGGLDPRQQSNLRSALTDLDDLSCCTIHGFCQRLVMPYPVEGNLDPGAAILDADEAARLFDQLFDQWLRDVLSDETSSLLSELIFIKPEEGIKLIREIATELRREPELQALEPSRDVRESAASFIEQARQFAAFIEQAEAEEPETGRVAECFREMATTVGLSLAKSRDTMLAELVTGRPHNDLCKADGDFRKPKRNVAKWAAAAKERGLSKAQGAQLSDQAEEHHERCCQAWRELIETAATTTLFEVVASTRPMLDAYQARKRSAALLDFDDLIFAAQRLLRANPEVRSALRKRYRFILVDEFQDTDPRQNEIFWLLASEDQASLEQPWPQWPLRPGALFLVGDPKQSIYRFRGADAAAYLAARASIERQSPDDVISITTNFRSCAPIIGFVNDRFEAPMNEEGQPGFHSLDAFHGIAEGQVCVAAYDVQCAKDGVKITADIKRDCEAEAVAELCAALIQSHQVTTKSGELRPCSPGDIALLAPTGKDLWRYEEALEQKGVPVSSQAGKGLFQRQEIHELIALTRVLADSRDTLALLALLRGPLVGLTEEELLDLAWITGSPAGRGLSLDVDNAKIAHPLARATIELLQELRARSSSTTPHSLLAEAIARLNVRANLRLRFGDHAGRALTNVDVYLELARRYSLAGLRAFAEAMRRAWEAKTAAVEGRIDAPEDAVALYTVHASKGLEWPIVVPINMMTRASQPRPSVVDRSGPTLHARVLGAVPAQFADASNREEAELRRERQRLWYVAATRARELLVLPRLNVEPDAASWARLVDLGLHDIGSLGLPGRDVLPGRRNLEAPTAVAQSAEAFMAEQLLIERATRTIRWTAPSSASTVVEDQERLEPEPDKAPTSEPIAGGATRGIILHKLIEEVLTGELIEEAGALARRAEVLAAELGEPAIDAPEIATTALRALHLAEIQKLRPRMVAEVPVLASEQHGPDGELITSGLADAVVLGEDGLPEVVIDWKSDVAPAAPALAHYEAQVRQYLKVTGARQGFIVLATTGRIIQVKAPDEASSSLLPTDDLIH